MQRSTFVSTRFLSSAGIALFLAACSSNTGTPTSGSTKSPAQNTGDSTQAYTRIIEGSWTLAPGAENSNLCVKKAITEDTYIHAIRPVNPLGTHHTLVTIGDANDDCRTSVPTGFVYAAGLGSQGLVLPDGVALKLPAGKVLDLSLHIYNTGTTELSGTSAMEVITMDPKDVVYESDSVLAGPLAFTLPAHQVTTIANDCALTADQSAFALFPHMHQLGTHFKTTVNMGGVPTVLHDADFLFNEQLQIPLDPILGLHAGDSISTECTYENTTDHDVTFGESSDTEMCFSVLFRYPKQGSGVCGGAGNPFAGGAATN
ncbi:MAG TPA: hypothetical protein VHU80_09160 [Polyangiaceae bacterium]|jgi:hypothetical protein|nr:hypothetical protein [Polyangiaceae bacterium]